MPAHTSLFARVLDRPSFGAADASQSRRPPRVRWLTLPGSACHVNFAGPRCQPIPLQIDVAGRILPPLAVPRLSQPCTLHLGFLASPWAVPPTPPHPTLPAPVLSTHYSLLGPKLGTAALTPTCRPGGRGGCHCLLVTGTERMQRQSQCQGGKDDAGGAGQVTAC